MLDVRIFQHEQNVETMNVDQKKIKNCVKGRLCVCVCVCVEDKGRFVMLMKVDKK